jgi:hypothetical protein
VSFGSPISISNYIANVGDGTNWKERLWAGGKAFTVNASAPVFNATTGFQIGGSSVHTVGLQRGRHPAAKEH